MGSTSSYGGVVYFTKFYVGVTHTYVASLWSLARLYTPSAFILFYFVSNSATISHKLLHLFDFQAYSTTFEASMQRFFELFIIYTPRKHCSVKLVFHLFLWLMVCFLLYIFLGSSYILRVFPHRNHGLGFDYENLGFQRRRNSGSKRIRAMRLLP